MYSFIRLLRLHQWLKNSFVLIGLVFAQQWHNKIICYQAMMAFLAFCCMSSAVYIYNDMHDKTMDQQHPYKKYRPLASGKVSMRQAILWMIFLMGIGFLLASESTSKVLLLLFSYFMLNIFYTHWLKKIAIIDVMVIASGFMLRIFAGTWALGIAPSRWLVLCGGMLTLLLGFSKRRAEYVHFNGTLKDNSRAVLKAYSPAFLDQMIVISASCCILSYSLYALYAPVLAHTTLIYTIPLVIYGIFRYLYNLYHTPWCAEDVAKIIWQDKSLFLAIILWLCLIGYVLA